MAYQRPMCDLVLYDSDLLHQRRIRDLVLDSDLKSIKKELELNEDLVNIEIGGGNTMLHFACYKNVDGSIAQWLIANGADKEVANYDGDKPIGNDNNEVSSFINLPN